jgi:hypothetical protein
LNGKTKAKMFDPRKFTHEVKVKMPHLGDDGEDIPGKRISFYSRFQAHI